MKALKYFLIGAMVTVTAAPAMAQKIDSQTAIANVKSILASNAPDKDKQVTNIAKAFKKFPLQTLRIYVTAQNLHTFTKYSGMDPEIGYGGDDYGWAQGIDLGYYPSSRNFLVGLSLKF